MQTPVHFATINKLKIRLQDITNQGQNHWRTKMHLCIGTDKNSVNQNMV